MESFLMADWVLENELKPRIVNPLANRDPNAVAPLMKCPGALLSGSDAGVHLQMFCGDAARLGLVAGVHPRCVPQ